MPVIPDTPAGRQLAAYLGAFNLGGDIALLRDFITDHCAPAMLGEISPDQRAAGNASLFSFTHGFDLRRIEQSTEHRIVAHLQARLDGHWAHLSLEVEIDPPHQITSLDLYPIPRPDQSGPQGRLSEEEILGALVAQLDRLIAADVFSGAVLVARDGVPIFTRANGMASVAYQVPMRFDTKMNLGSMNKMFTATVIVQLAEQGRLAFDEHISTYLPDYPRAVADKVTIHQLLTHTAGLGSYWNDKFEATKARVRTVSDFRALFVDDPLAFEPGERWQYSNAGYIVLGAIVEAITGRSYFDHVREHIYLPAGMDNTDAYELDRDTPNLAMGYTRGDLAGTFDPGPRRNNLFMHGVKGGPAGGGYSTVEDLLRFDRALRTHVLLRPHSTEMLLAGKVNIPGPSGSQYAYGFNDQRINGQRIVGHGGGFPGINGQLDMYLDRGYTVAVLANYDPPAAQLVASKLRELFTQE
jgi:CubicO group peptidase (beta-lactamase class C family)